MSKMLSKMNLISAVQQLPDEDIKLVQNYVEMIEKENAELKKQLKERPKEYVFIGNAQNKTRDFINRITKDNKEYEAQQQEFIKYLEDEIKENSKERINDNNSYQMGVINTYENIIEKYKEIIGGEK